MLRSKQAAQFQKQAETSSKQAERQLRASKQEQTKGKLQVHYKQVLHNATFVEGNAPCVEGTRVSGTLCKGPPW